MAIDKKKLEILKVWYSIFCVLMDDKELSIDQRYDKLLALRSRLKAESPELEIEIKNMKN